MFKLAWAVWPLLMLDMTCHGYFLTSDSFDDRSLYIRSRSDLDSHPFRRDTIDSYEFPRRTFKLQKRNGFTNSQGLSKISGKSLNKMTAGFATSVNDKIEPTITQKFDDATNYVYVGLHVTSAWLRDGVGSGKHSGAMVGKGKMNSILQNGLRPSSIVGLYGPGTYITQRPAIGEIAASGITYQLEAAGITKEKLEKEQFGIYMLHLFLPEDVIKKLNQVPVKLIPDFGIDNNPELAKAQASNGLTKNSDRQAYGLDKNTVVVAAPDEIVLGDQVTKELKFFGELVGTKANWYDYHNWRKENKPKLPAPWSAHGLPKLEKIIQPPKYLTMMKQHFFDFKKLPKATKIHPYWSAYAKQPTRSYKRHLQTLYDRA